MQVSSWRVRTKLSFKPSDALRCLGSVLRPGLWAWACVGQLGGMGMEGIDLHWLQIREMALTPGSSLWPHPQFSLALHLPFWDMEVCAWLCGHYTIFTEGVGEDASGFPLRPVGGGVRVVFKWTKHLASPPPHNLWFNQSSSILTSAWNIEWKESMVQKCSENQKTRPLCFKLPSWPINGSHNLVGWIS